MIRKKDKNMTIEKSNEIRGRAWCREFFDQAIADIMDRVDQMADIVDHIKERADSFDLKEKNPAAYAEMLQKMELLDQDIEAFADAIMKR